MQYMKTNYKLIFALIIALLPQLAIGQKGPSGKKVALVIGNNNYITNSKFPKLNNCESDADSVAWALKDMGFEVITRKNLSRTQTSEEIRAFKLKEKNVALIYYSGHGMQDRGRNYIIPVDCEYSLDDRDQIDDYAFNVQEILDYYNQPTRYNKVNILIVDACRNSTFLTRSAIAPTADISGLSIYDNTFLAFSTNSGNAASDNNNKQNGLFTQELLKNIRKPMPISEIMRQTKNTVVSLSNGDQIPNFTDNLSTPFYFKDIDPEDKNYKVVYTQTQKDPNSNNYRSGASALNILIIPRQPDFTSISNMLNDPATRSVIDHLSSILENKNITPVYYDFTSNKNVNDDKSAIVKKSGADRYVEVDITAGDDGTGASAATVTLKGITSEGRVLFTKRYSSPYFRTNDIGVLAIRALKDKDEELVSLFTK